MNKTQLGLATISLVMAGILCAAQPRNNYGTAPSSTIEPIDQLFLNMEEEPGIEEDQPVIPMRDQEELDKTEESQKVFCITKQSGHE